MKTHAALVMALLGATMPAHAQEPLPPRWELTPIATTGPFLASSIACSRDRAFARSTLGDVRVFDGVRWTELPRPSTRGRHIWASPQGRVVVDGTGGQVHAWDGSRWNDVPLDPWLSRRTPDVSAIDGLGERPWVLGRGAIALAVDPDRDPMLRAHDVANAWYPLHDLEVVAADRVYVAGARGLLRWDGRAWSLEPTGIEGEVQGVRAFGAGDVWAWSHSAVAHFDGRSWSRRDEALALGPPPPRRHRGSVNVHLDGRPGEVYLTTLERVYRFDGARWTAELEPAHRAPGAAYRAVCATERFLVVLQSSHALIRR